MCYGTSLFSQRNPQKRHRLATSEERIENGTTVTKVSDIEYFLSLDLKLCCRRCVSAIVPISQKVRADKLRL